MRLPRRGRASLIASVENASIVGIRQLVYPADSYPDLTLIEDACLQVENGLFTYVGPRSGAPRTSAPVIDLEGAVVTPGLVDAHTHFVWAGTRADDYELRSRRASYAEIAAQGGGIMSTVRAVRDASDEELRRIAKRNLGWMVACGTVAAEVKSGYGLTTEDEIRMLKTADSVATELGVQIHKTALAAHAVPPEFSDADAYWRQVKEEILPEMSRQVGFDSVDMFVEEGYFRPEHARELAAEASRYGAKVRLHVDQMRDSGGAALAAEIGAFSADHLEWTSEAGMEAMLDAGVTPVLLPGSVYGLGLSRYPDVRKMIEMGLRPVVATDFNPGSAPSPSLPFAGGLAMLYMGMSPQEVLWGITGLAASCIQVDAGVIEVGGRANLCAWNIEDWRELFLLTGSGLLVASIFFN